MVNNVGFEKNDNTAHDENSYGWSTRSQSQSIMRTHFTLRDTSRAGSRVHIREQQQTPVRKQNKKTDMRNH
jgi:hypothetical protein